MEGKNARVSDPASACFITLVIQKLLLLHMDENFGLNMNYRQPIQ